MERHTKQADEFLTLIGELDGPFTVDDVSNHLANHTHGLSRATLFRYLKHAITNGAVRLVPHLGGDRLYERTSAHHHHLACPNCERVQDLAEACTEPADRRPETLVRVLICERCSVER